MPNGYLGSVVLAAALALLAGDGAKVARYYMFFFNRDRKAGPTDAVIVGDNATSIFLALQLITVPL